jgi:hypothetical protein
MNDFTSLLNLLGPSTAEEMQAVLAVIAVASAGNLATVPGLNIVKRCGNALEAILGKDNSIMVEYWQKLNQKSSLIDQNSLHW